MKAVSTRNDGISGDLSTMKPACWTFDLCNGPRPSSSLSTRPPASSAEDGSATEEIEVDYQGDVLEVGFNAGYLLDIVRQIEGSNARMLMADAASPTIFSEVDDPGVLYVLMPMRV